MVVDVSVAVFQGKNLGDLRRVLSCTMSDTEQPPTASLETDDACVVSFEITSTSTVSKPVAGQAYYVQVLRDDIGFFADPEIQNVVWIKARNAREVFAMRSYGPDELHTGDGFALQHTIFAGKAGDRKSRELKSRSRVRSAELELVGVVDELEGVGAGSFLQFRRSVSRQAAPPEMDFLSAPYTEEVWFQKERGMVRLVQTVDGMISMTWTLKEHAPGER